MYVDIVYFTDSKSNLNLNKFKAHVSNILSEMSKEYREYAEIVSWVQIKDFHHYDFLQDEMTPMWTVLVGSYKTIQYFVWCHPRLKNENILQCDDWSRYDGYFKYEWKKHFDEKTLELHKDIW